MLRHHDRIGWAVSDLLGAEALERPSRGHYRITDLGWTLLSDHPTGMTERDLLSSHGSLANRSRPRGRRSEDLMFDKTDHQDAVLSPG
jgi:restriction endonuclease Mrr